MVCLGFEPGAAGWKAHTNPLSYGGKLQLSILGVLSFTYGSVDYLPTAKKLLYYWSQVDENARKRERERGRRRVQSQERE